MNKAKATRTGTELHDAATKGFPLSRIEIAACLRVHPETVSAYVKQGMPCLYTGKVQKATKGSKPVFIFSRCMEWLEKRNSSNY